MFVKSMMMMMADYEYHSSSKESDYTSKTSFPKISNLESPQRPCLRMDDWTCLFCSIHLSSGPCLSLLSGCSFVWLSAYRRALGPCPATWNTTETEAWFYLGTEPLIALEAANWACR